MPIIRFSGVKAQRAVIFDMMYQIKIWAAFVEGLEIGPEHVRPIYMPIIQENPGECVIFEVLELFSVSLNGTARTTGMRKELCQSIESGFNEFVTTGKLTVTPKKAVVIIRMVDRAEGEFHHWPIPNLLRSL